MKSLELKKRIITSIFLLTLLFLMFSYSFILIISSIVIGLISWIEFYALISKIFKKKSIENQILRFLYKSSSLLYLSGLVFIIISAKLVNLNLYFVIIYSKVFLYDSFNLYGISSQNNISTFSSSSCQTFSYLSPSKKNRCECHLFSN